MKVLKNGLALIVECLVAIEVLICVGELPTLFENLGFHLKNYFHAILDFTLRFYTFQKFTYHLAGLIVPLFPIILQKYIYTIEILVFGILTACILAFMFAYLSLLLFRKRISLVNQLMELAESLPDLIFFLLIQMLVIFIYKQTGVRIALVVSLDQKAVILPVICLAIPGSFYMAKVMILYIQEELDKDYVTLVKAKGFSFSYLLSRHVLRNIAERVFATSKTMIWTMLSSMLIIERLFNMNALVALMFSGTDAFIIGCMLLFLPFFILYRIFDWASFDNRKDAN